MSGNVYRRLFRLNLFYHFISWTAGEITFRQMLHRAIVKPLLVVAVVGVLGAALMYGLVVSSWVEGYQPKYGELPGWVLWLRHTIGKEPTTEPEALTAKRMHRKADVLAGRVPTRSDTVDTPDAEVTTVSVPANSELNAPAQPKTSGGDTTACDGDGNSAAECLKHRLLAADTLLNTEYRATMQRLDIPGQRELRERERIWIRARDARCRGYDGTDRDSCVLEMTAARTAQLRGY